MIYFLLAAPSTPQAAQQPRMPMANMNNKPSDGGGSGGGFYGKNKANGPFNVQNVPNTPGGTPTRVHPIGSLTPYQNRWERITFGILLIEANWRTGCYIFNRNANWCVDISHFPLRRQTSEILG